MKRSKRRYMTKAISLVAALALAVGLIPAPAFAIAGEAGGESDRTTTLTAGGGNFEAADGGQADYAMLVQSETITKKEMLDLTKSLVTSAIKGDPKTAAQTVLTWGAGKLINQLFGDMGNEKEATLEDVLAAIDKLNTAISELQTTVDSQQLDNILNSLNPLLSYKTSYDVYKALRDIDAKQAAGTYSDAQAKQLVQSELTTSLKNGRPNDIASLATVGDQSSFDRFTELLWSAMTDMYHVTISGDTHDYTLMQIWFEHLRYKYHWEHQAYDEWASFQSQCVTLLATTLALEKASLQTRIELIQKWNEDHPDELVSEGSCISRLKTVQDHINQMAGYKGKGINDEDVEYPGFFSENTWDETYWLCKERDESERYYWTPGHEVLFYAKVNTQDIPPELDTAGLGMDCRNSGIEMYWSTFATWHVTDVSYTSCWIDFLMYSQLEPGYYAPLATRDQLRTIYKDYGSKTHLYDIFIKPENGNFLGLDETGIDTWYFVVDPSGDYGVYWKQTDAYEGQARCHVLTSAHAEDDTATLETYTLSEAWRNKRRHFIGIGVKSVGLQTGGYQSVVPEVRHYNTSVEGDSALWWPSCGDLSISYDNAKRGNLVKASMDGTEISTQSYKAGENSLVLSKAYMETLGFGKHTLELTCEKANHTIIFYVKKKQDVSVVENVSKTFGDQSFNLEAKSVGDGAFSYESSNAKVASVDSNGKVTIKGAGTAKITVIAAETGEFAPAISTVTVTVDKAKNPMTLAKNSATVKYAKLKKAKCVVAGPKVKMAQGKVTYSITKAVKGKKNFQKKFSIDKKTGKITVEKGTAKGTYKVTVKAEAAGNASYKPGLKTAVVTIKVK